MKKHNQIDIVPGIIIAMILFKFFLFFFFFYQNLFAITWYTGGQDSS